MIKSTMPEPVVEVDKYNNSSELQYTYLSPYGGLSHGTYLITTTQAEAYADARVREALEEAAEIADRNNDFSTYDAIRALIPPLPGPVEP